MSKTIIVAGITRSGLTLTMQMLHAGGYPCFGEYPAFEPIQEIGAIPWTECLGKAVKVVDTHTQFPPTGEYHVIRLRRDYKQQARSIGKFLKEVVGIPQSRALINQYEKSLPADYRKIDEWAKRQKGLLELDFEDIIKKPSSSVFSIANFINTRTEEIINLSAMVKMVNVVEQRSPDCYPGMLEYKFKFIK